MWTFVLSLEPSKDLEGGAFVFLPGCHGNMSQWAMVIEGGT